MQTQPDDHQFPWLREPSPHSDVTFTPALDKAVYAMGSSNESEKHIQTELDRFLDQFWEPDTNQKPINNCSETFEPQSEPQRRKSPRYPSSMSQMKQKSPSEDELVFVDDDDDTYIIGLESLIEKRFPKEQAELNTGYSDMGKISDARHRIITDCDADHGSVRRPISPKKPQNVLRKGLSDAGFQRDVSDTRAGDVPLPNFARLHSNDEKPPESVQASKKILRIPVFKPSDQQADHGNRHHTDSGLESISIRSLKHGKQSAIQNRSRIFEEVQRKLLRYSCIPPCCLSTKHKNPDVILISTLASSSPEFANCQDFIDLKACPGYRFRCQRIAKVFAYHLHSVWRRFHQQLSTDWMPLGRHANNSEFEFAFHISDHDKLSEIFERGFVSQGGDYTLLCYDALTSSHHERINSKSRCSVDRVLLCHIRRSRTLLYDKPTDMKFDYKSLKKRWMTRYDCIVFGETAGSRSIFVLAPEHCIPLYLIEYRAIEIEELQSPYNKPKC